VPPVDSDAPSVTPLLLASSVVRASGVPAQEPTANPICVCVLTSAPLKDIDGREPTAMNCGLTEVMLVAAAAITFRFGSIWNQDAPLLTL